MTPHLSEILVEGRRAPVGLDTPPRISWIVTPDQGLIQERYRVIVAAGDSVVADSAEQAGATNRWTLEAPLESLRRYSVEVTVQTNRGETSTRTEFTTGILRDEDWGDARWITASDTADDGVPALRRIFTAAEQPRRHLLAIAVAGCAAIRVNGTELGERLIGGITDFTRRVQYTVLDISPFVRPGTNELLVELGNAFYGMTSPNTWNWETAPWHATPSVKALLVHEGSTDRLCTDSAWEAARGRTIYNDYFGGETYDARRDVRWAAPITVAGPAGRLESARQPPIRVCDLLEHTASTRVGETWVLDFGRVVAGWVNLAFRAAPGQELLIRYGEKLRDDGLPNNDDPLGYFDGRFQEDVYLASGTDDVERWHPQFGWKSFRYVAIDGWADAPPSRLEVTASHVRTDVSRDGEFHSSSDVLNGIHSITVDTMLNNLHGIPTDTPMYEKNGWTGDGMVAAEMFLLNFGAASLLDKWVDDIVDTTAPDGTPKVIAPDGGWTLDWEPCPTWHSALVLIPWWLYVYTGDARVLERTYENVARYVSTEVHRSEGGIAQTTLGDWLAPETSPGGGNPEEDLRVSATAFLFAQCVTAARIARAIGRSDGAEMFERHAAEVRRAFLDAFFDTRRGYVCSREDRDGFSQTHQVLAVGLGVLTGEQRDRALAALVDDIRGRGDHLNTGLLSTKYLLPVLSDHGYHDVAVAVALQTTYPSWGFWLQQGATTTWEHWHPASRSRNHFALGTVDEWLYTHVLGISPRTPGFDQISVSLRPIASITSAQGGIMTPNGPVRIAWTIDDERLALEVTVPTGSVGTIDVDPSYLPGELPARSTEVGPGTHRLVWDDVRLASDSAGAG